MGIASECQRFSEKEGSVKWSQRVGGEGLLPGSTKSFFVVCGHEFEVRPLSTVCGLCPAIVLWVQGGVGGQSD